jgi:hypothetical protein
VDQRQGPAGPEVSWPGAHYGPEHSGGDDRYQAQPRTELPAAPGFAAPPGPGEHPYAAYDAAGYSDNGQGYAGPAIDAFGYGDPGYSNPGYNGPSSQDAGVAGTRTVRGYVEPGFQQDGYQQGGDPRALPAPAPQDYPARGYGQPGGYSEPWDYDKPLRYDDDGAYPGPGHPSGPYPVQDGHDAYGSYGHGGHGARDYGAPAYDQAAYNGSDLSRPGISGAGYDLSGIIGTSDFPAFGYDEPSVERLSYDDPRYADGPGGQPRHGAPQGYDQGDSRHDGRRFDETRLDSFWGEDQPDRSDWFGNGGSAYGRELPSGPGRARPTGSFPVAPGRSDQTRLDLGFRALGMSDTRMDMRALRDDPLRYGQTRMDGLRAVSTGPMEARSATGLLTRPGDRWADDTSLDSFAGLDLDDMPGLREESSRAVAAALREAPPLREETGGQRTVGGKRRGRNSDRRQWMALGAVAVLAVGAMGAVLAKFAFSGPSGPAHTISTPNQLDTFTRNPALEKTMKVGQLRDDVMATSAGQASNVKSALYSMGDTTPGMGGGNQQVFMFVGGNLANSDPAASLASFKQQYPHATTVSAGALGGAAACTPAVSHGEQVSMCVWFDNDSFGDLMSPGMSTSQLAHTMVEVRPNVEAVDR